MVFAVLYNEKSIGGVTALEIANVLCLSALCSREELKNTIISSKEISRLSLNLIGSFANYVQGQPLMIGRTELEFLEKNNVTEQARLLDLFRKFHVPLFILTSSVDRDFEFLDSIKKLDVPVLKLNQCTHKFLSNYYSYMETRLSKTLTVHGELMEIYGYGVLITGESGIGKSECAIELVKRGHKFIADDAVTLKKIEGGRAFVGFSPNNIRGFVELRGVGIVNIQSMFGMSSIKSHQKINLEIDLYKSKLSDNKTNRLKLVSDFSEKQGVYIPKIEIPVAPGRNMATIIEVAVMNERSKAMGYNATNSLLEKLKAAG